MKKQLLVILALLLSAYNAFADGITVGDIILNNDVAKSLDINLSNTSTDIVGVQFNLTLPDGIVPVMDGDRIVITASNRLNGSYMLRGSKVSDGSYLFTFLSNDRTAIVGTEGTLFSISLQNSTTADGQYSATLSNVIITDKNGNDQTLDDATFSITIEHKYTLTYKVDGIEYKSVIYTVGAVITPETEPAKEGYTFSGWSEIPQTMPAHDVDVNGSFTVNQYKVTFISDGATIQETTQDYGSAITKPADPTKEGYTFTGWNPSVDATVPAHDVTYTAQFSINSYKLTYKVDGSVYKEYTVEYGAVITPETEPTKEGYTFSGWSDIPETMPAHDVEVTGSFSVNYYKVSYYVDNELVHEDEIAFGEEFSLWNYEPTNPSQIFNGWIGEVYETMPAHDISYTADITIDGIINISAENNIEGIYTLDGKKVENMHRGVYIVRMKNGTTKTIVVK